MTRKNKADFLRLVKCGAGTSYAATELGLTNRKVRKALRDDPKFRDQLTTLVRSNDDLLESIIYEGTLQSPGVALALASSTDGHRN